MAKSYGNCGNCDDCFYWRCMDAGVDRYCAYLFCHWAPAALSARGGLHREGGKKSIQEEVTWQT